MEVSGGGIKIDEGPREGGPHGPYRQSERKAPTVSMPTS